jgi:hypothetical protein
MCGTDGVIVEQENRKHYNSFLPEIAGEANMNIYLNVT